MSKRFEAYGWNVIRVEDANDIDALDRAFAEFKTTTDRPTFISVRSHIGYGSPNKQDSYGAHGAPLGEEEVRLTKRAYGWPEDAQFRVPDEVVAGFRDGVGKRGHELRTAWDATFRTYAAQYPELADELNRMQRRDLPDDWDADLPSFPADAKGLAGRVASGKVLNTIAERVPWLLGGAADLAPRPIRA